MKRKFKKVRFLILVIMAIIMTFLTGSAGSSPPAADESSVGQPDENAPISPRPELAFISTLQASSGRAKASPSAGTASVQAPLPSASITSASSSLTLTTDLSARSALPAGPQEEAFRTRFKQAMLAVYDARTRQDLEKAADEFLAARALAPSNPEVNYNLGLVFLQLDEYARACDFFEDYLSLAPTPEDAAMASGLLSRARLLQQRFDRSLNAMLNPRAWRLIEVKPAELDSSWFSPEFRLAKNGQIQVKNPRLNYSPLDKEPMTKKNPWLPLTFRGRYFEFLVCLARQRACEAGQGHCLIQGEIVFDGPRVLVVARNFRYDPYTREAEKGAGYIVVYELAL